MRLRPSSGLLFFAASCSEQIGDSWLLAIWNFLRAMLQLLLLVCGFISTLSRPLLAWFDLTFESRFGDKVRLCSLAR